MDWRVREQSLAQLEGPLRRFSGAIDECFAVLDAALEEFAGRANEDSFMFFCGVTATKARRLAWGYLSLALDGLSADAPILLRPLLEAFELLVYFEQDPSRIAEAREDRLPSPGNVAKAIEGSFAQTRRYLNRHSSHIGYSVEAVLHLVDHKALRFRGSPRFDAQALHESMQTLSMVLGLINRSALDCLERDPAAKLDSLRRRERNVRKRCQRAARALAGAL